MNGGTFGSGCPATGNVIVVEKGRPVIFLQVLYRVGRDADPAIRAVIDVLRELWSDQEATAKRPANKRGDDGNGVSQMRMVKSGSSYLSQSELPVTFGLGKHDEAERISVEWPSGKTEDFKKLAAGKEYECVEGRGISVRQG